MDIIGKTNDGFIVRMSGRELKRLTRWANSERHPDHIFSVGAQVDIDKMYEQLYGLAKAQRELEAASKTLHSIANLLLVANPLIEAVIHHEEPTEKEG